MYKKMVPADVYARRIVFGRPAYRDYSMMRQNQMDSSGMLNRTPQGNAFNLCKQREIRAPAVEKPR